MFLNDVRATFRLTYRCQLVYLLLGVHMFECLSVCLYLQESNQSKAARAGFLSTLHASLNVPRREKAKTRRTVCLVMIRNHQDGRLRLSGVLRQRAKS